MRVLLALAQSTAAGGDPVWDAAVRIVAQSRIAPAAAIATTVHVDSAGRETGRSETWVRFEPLRDGRLASEIIYRSENGRTLSRRERERRNRADTRRRDAAPFRIAELPLSPELQTFVRYRRVAAAADRLVFEFDLERDGHSMFGTVVVTPEGRPLEIDFEPRPLPPFFESLRSTLRFDVAGEGRVRLASMSVRGSAGALWVRRGLRTEFRFLETLPRPPSRE